MPPKKQDAISRFKEMAADIVLAFQLATERLGVTREETAPTVSPPALHDKPAVK